ncbi:MAG: uroporphyrinogen decarboxylase family protein [Armatimonadota bacterium]
MTSRERFLKIMAFEPVDRIPNYELGCWGQTIQRWVDEGMPEIQLYNNWFEGEPYFGLERKGYAPINIGMLPTFPYEVLEETEEHVTARHSNGIVTKARKTGTVRGTRLCMDQYLSHPVTDRASFAEMKKRYDPTTLTRYPLWWDEWARIWATRDYPVGLLQNGTFGLYSQLRSWVGTEEISYLFYDDPALVEEMVEFNTEFFLTLVERALGEAQFDFFNFFEDFAGKGGPLVSPQVFKKFLLPAYQKITARLRKAGITSIWLDSDGDPEALIPLLLEAGITTLWPLEQASGMDPVRLRKIYGTDLAFAGGIDKRELFTDKKAIDAELYAKIPPMLESGGYLPFLDHTFSPEISYENFLYYLEVKKKLLERG